MMVKPVQLHKMNISLQGFSGSLWTSSEVNAFWSLTPEDPSLPEIYNEALRILADLGNLFGMRPVICEKFTEVHPPIGRTPYKDPNATWHFRISFLPENIPPNGKTTALAPTLLLTSRHPFHYTTAYEMGVYYPRLFPTRGTTSNDEFPDYVAEVSMKCLEKFMDEMLYMTSVSEIVPSITIHDIPHGKFSFQLPIFSTMEELRMKLSLQGRIGSTGRLKEIERLGE